METIAYVYKWTHLPTLKWYVGARYGKTAHPADDYICSSNYVKPLIKNNPFDWQKSIVATGTPDEMLQLESSILQLFDAKNDYRSFNMHNGDAKFRLKFRTEESKIKQSQTLTGRSNWWCKGKPSWNAGLTGIFKHTEEYKKWNSERQKGSLNHMFGRKGKGNPNFGSKRSEETKQKIRDAFKTIPLKCSCVLCHKEVTAGTLHNHIGGRFCAGYERPKFSCLFCKQEMWISSRHNHFRLSRCKGVI